MKNIFFFRNILLLCILLLPAFVNGQNNIIPNTLDCSSTRPPFNFDIQQRWATNGVSNFSTPLSGDLDGDGNTEVLVMSSAGTSLLFFEGKTGASAGSINTGKLATEPCNPYVICDVDGDGKAEILIVNVATTPATATLYTVTSAPGVRPLTFGTKWKTNLPEAIKPFTKYGGPVPCVADLDGDGKPEFIVAQYIIETDGHIAATLQLAGGIISSGPPMTTAFAADLDNDGIPEAIVGTDVYKYNGTTATLWRRCPSFPSGREGSSMAADINLDGTVDLVYHDNYTQASGSIVVWTPLTNTVIGTIADLPSGWRCYPVIGDIDGIEVNGKKYPEICYNGINHFSAYSFNGTSFSLKWKMKTNEQSGLATFTFFDFNLDNVVELVYRDEKKLRVLDCRTNPPTDYFSMDATSGTIIETPIVADVTGDGSANIVVTGSNKLYVFEGKTSKWASCPNVWNQQLYSPLLINRDLTVISNVASPAWNEKNCDNEYPRLYNGGPMQVPFISSETYCHIDLSPDVYIVSGDIAISGSTATISVVIGNQGLAVAPSTTPIQFYKNSISPANRITSAATTLGVDLQVGETHTITKTITGLSPMPSQFYVRVLDDGINFPALGSFSDCNVTNNTKPFGTLELLKTVNSQNACTDGTSIFYVDLINNTNLLGDPKAFNNIKLIDNLGPGWEFISASALKGTLGAYDPITRKMEWTIPVLNAGETARLIVIAKAIEAGAIRNTAWVESVNSVTIGKEVIEAFVIVNSTTAPPAATISPVNPKLCDVSGVNLTASVSGATSYQWYKDNIEISGAIHQSYTATALGSYTVTYFDGTCVSQMSTPVVVTEDCLKANTDAVEVVKNASVIIDVLANDDLGTCTTATIELTINSTPAHGTAVVEGKKIKYTAGNSIGSDNFTYKIKCGVQESTANVNVTIHSTLMVKKEDNASEPNNAGKFIITFTDNGFQYSGAALKIYYKLEGTAICGQDYESPLNYDSGVNQGFVIMPINGQSIPLNITPKDNYKVEGNNRTIEVTITSVEEI